MLFEFSIFPLGQTSGLSGEVSRMIGLIEKSGLPFQLTGMGTLVEGDWDEVMELIGRCHALMRESHERVYAVIKADYHQGREGRLKGKVESVERRLGRPVNR